MTNENFFKHDNKAYTENLNDAILIANAFDYQVPVNIPGMYLNNHFPTDTNVHKAGVADVTIISSGSLSIGDTSITNNSNTSQVLRLRVYPNFNSFYAWKKLNWTCTGDVTVNICDAGTSTSLLPSGALTNPDNETLLNGISSLQGLKEYDLLITIPTNCSLNSVSIVFVNNWNSQNRVSASINQSNVAGLESSLSNLDSAITTGLSGLSDDVEAVSDRVTSLENGTTGSLRLNDIYFQGRCYWYKNNNMVAININAPARINSATPSLWGSADLPASVTPARDIYGVAIVKDSASDITPTTVPFIISSLNGGASILGSLSAGNVVYINIVYSLL